MRVEHRTSLSRLAMAALGSVVVATALIVSGPPARAATAAGPTDTVTTYTKTADVRITMRDGISLDSDEYVPNGPGIVCPCPVILVQTPYRKSDATVSEFNPYFPSHGYAEIVVDVRGTGSSGGTWTSFGTPEQLDGVELVKWAMARPFSNHIVGLAGVSYSAINQFLTVEQCTEDPTCEGAVKAIFPIVPMGDPYRDVVFAGGNTDTGFIPLWLGLVNALNNEPSDDATSQPAIALNVASQHVLDVAQFAAPAIADTTLGADERLLPKPLQTYPEQAYDNDYYHNVAPLFRIQDVHVPTFIVGGEYDLFQRSEPLLYRGISLPTTEKKLLYGPWYHGNPSSHLSSDDGKTVVTDEAGNVVPSTNNLSLAWFDHWLKGFDNHIEDFPTTETFQIGQTGPSQWRPDAAFPYPGTTYQPWYLGDSPSGSGAQSLYDGSVGTSVGRNDGSALVPWQPLTGACSRSTAQWTAGIVAVSNCESDDSSSEITGLTFTSPVFTQPYTVNGPIVADLWLSSTRPDTTITATIGDLQTDGSTVFRVTAGSLVSSLRAVDKTPCGAKVMFCSVVADSIPVVPWHPYTQASQKALTSKPTEALVEVFPTSWVVQPGHRLRLSITTADLPHQGPNLTTLANSLGGITSLYFGKSHPSRVYLGTLGAITLGGGPPASVPVSKSNAAASRSAATSAQVSRDGAAAMPATGVASTIGATPAMRDAGARGAGATVGYGLLAAAGVGVALRGRRRRRARRG